MTVRWQGPFTGRHVLALLLGFFAVVIAVNGAFVALATGTWRGVEGDHPYREGLAYNRVLEQAESQRALGWTAAIRSEGRARGETIIVVRVDDRRGRPVTGLAVRAAFRRPVQEGFDREVELAPNGAGEYRAALRLPLPGQWEVVVTARGRFGAAFVATRRVRSE